MERTESDGSGGGTGDGDPTGLRALLFGDRPIDEWPIGDEVEGEPWRWFLEARRRLRDGDVAGAAAIWREIAAVPDAEPRHVLQAWHHLRSVGEAPPPEVATVLLGVVVEVAIGPGHDVLAAYPDGAVRYLNVGGGAVIVEGSAATADIATRTVAVLTAGREIVAALGPWDGAALPDLPPGHSRLTMLTPSGPHFGQGPSDDLLSSPLAAPLVAAATDLLVAVVAQGGVG